MSKQRILLFGGTFDPIHHGHLIACQSIAEKIRAARIILIPCAASPFKADTRTTAADHRLEMCRRAAELDPRFEVSDIELKRGGKSYTFDTVKWFSDALREDCALYWLIGADSLAQLSKWYKARELVELCQFVVAARPPMPEIAWDEISAAFGEDTAKRLRAHVFATPLIDISATDLRNRAASDQCLQFRVPPAVAEYIAQHNLYGDSDGAALVTAN